MKYLIAGLVGLVWLNLFAYVFINGESQIERDNERYKLLNSQIDYRIERASK